MADNVDWSALAERLHVRRLLPTLGPRILELAGESGTGDFAENVQKAVVATRRREGFLALVAGRAISTLTEAGISCAPLKGPQLADAIYGDIGRRISNDIDLLVAPERLRDAVEVVQGLGYQAPSDHLDASGLPRLNFELIHEGAALPPVELHWRVHWYESSFARERLLVSEDGEGSKCARPASVDELAGLMLFYARDGFRSGRGSAAVRGRCCTWFTTIPVHELQRMAAIVRRGHRERSAAPQRDPRAVGRHGVLQAERARVRDPPGPAS